MPVKTYWLHAEEKAEKNSPSVMSSYVRHNLKTIKSQIEIKNLLRTGIKKYTKFGIFFLQKNSDTEKCYAVLVKKSVGIAVKRNYYKRLIREYIRNNTEIFSDYSKIVFVINKKIDVPFSELKVELDQKFSS